jgi:predicted secreted protein
MTAKLGLDAKLYRNSGTYAIPAWNEITNAKDVTLNLEASEADASRRGSAGWRETLRGLKDGSVEFEMVYDGTDAEFQALRDAFLNGTTVEVAVLDGDVTTTGTQGLRATMSVINFSRNEPLEEALTVSVTVKPAPAANPPEWMTV